MARPLAAIERFFERLLERPAARLFRAPLQPVQLERRLERAMEAGRRLSAGRTYVPNRFRVQLHPTDFAALAGFQGTLEVELAEALGERARQRGYSVVDRIGVSLHANAGVARGDIGILSELAEPVERRPAPEGFRRDEVEPDLPGSSEAGATPPPEGTAVFAVQAPAAPRVVLRVTAPDGSAREIWLSEGSLTIGRAADNDLVLADARVSRHHGRFAARAGRLVYTDLESLNGSFVNGERVAEVVVGPGDELRLGSSRLLLAAE
jgi:hypothetical protein